MSVRAKVIISSITEYESPKGSRHVTMRPVFKYQEGVVGNACLENHIFSDATPSGEIKMQINNPAAAKQFNIGQSYYVDFTEAHE